MALTPTNTLQKHKAHLRLRLTQTRICGLRLEASPVPAKPARLLIKFPVPVFAHLRQPLRQSAPSQVSLVS